MDDFNKIGGKGKCAVCNNQYIKTGRNQKYCSISCRRKNGWWKHRERNLKNKRRYQNSKKGKATAKRYYERNRSRILLYQKERRLNNEKNKSRI